MATKHEVRVTRTKDGHRAECETCDWRSQVRQTSELAEFLGMSHGDKPESV